MDTNDIEKTARREADIAAEARRLTPPSESGVSTVLNGVGNVTMISTAAFVAWELYNNIRYPGLNKQLPYGANVALAFALAGGTTLGAVLGAHEAKRLKEYRNALGEEIIDLRAQSAANMARLDKWEAKLAAQEQQAGEPGHKIG